MRTILLLDTSIQGALLGIARSQDLRHWQLGPWVWHEHPQAAAATLPRLCSDLIQEAGLTFDALDQLVIGVGPGSFTGIKIGLSFAYGLHKARPSLSLVGVSALEALARRESNDRPLLLMATQTSGYFATKQGGKTLLGVVDAESDWQLEQRGAESAKLDWPEAAAVLGVWPRVTAMLASRGIRCEELPLPSLAESILQAILQDFVANSSKLSDGLPGPIYLRKSAPEEKLERGAAQGVSEALHKGGS